MVTDWNYVNIWPVHSPDQILSMIHQYFVYICCQSNVIQATIKKCKTLGHFWKSLYGMNINQKDCTHPDQVLLTIAGIFLHFVNHPEPNVAKHMCTHIEKWWKDYNQSLFILCLVLNPYEGCSAFGQAANLSSFFKLHTMLMTVGLVGCSEIYFTNYLFILVV